jgi:CheY-like chemotaxis protein
MMPRTATRCPVLIVEDDEDLREMMAQMLTLEGFEAVTVANGREALEYLQDAKKPDVIILDLMMPVMDGMTFLDTIRRNPKYFSLPVVVATAKQLTLQEIRQLETSVSVVLRKGDDLRADLSRVVRRLLRVKNESGAGEAGAKGRILVKVRPLIADMVPGFLAARRKEVVAIGEALERNELEPIRVMGHNMKGIGSSYGFPPITEFGRRLEEAAVAGTRDEIRKQVAGLADYLERVEVTSE